MPEPTQPYRMGDLEGAAAEPNDPCPECYPDRPDARVRYRCGPHADGPEVER